MELKGLAIAAALGMAGCVTTTGQVDCRDVLGRVEISTVLEKHKEVRTRDFFEDLVADGYSDRDRELIADLAGVANPNLDDTTRDPLAVSELPPLPSRFPAIPTERFLEVRRLIANGHLDELAALVGDIPSLVRGQVVGQTVAALLVQQPPAVLGASMERLIEAGFEFALHELAFAIVSDVPLATFELLLANSDADLAASWTDHSQNRPMDLVALAASKSRFHLLHALLEREPDPEASRALDYLPEPANDVEVAATEAAVKRLAAAGYRPLLPSTLTRFRAWMPDATLASVNHAVPGLTPRVRAVGARFGEETRRLDAEISNAREDESHCLDDGTGQSNHGGSLLAKRKISGERSSNMVPDVDIAAIFGPLSASIESNIGPWFAVMDAATGSRWDDFLDIVERLPEDADEQTLTFATRMALSRASDDVVAKTLARTGDLPEDAAIRIVSRATDDAIEVLRGIREHNLNLHFTDTNGLNAVGAAARTMMFRETLDYLLDQGVAVKPDAPGYDALDYVLLNLVNQPRFRTSHSALPWIRALINHGAPIEASHLQSMELLRLDRPATYADIVEEVPELAPST